MTVDPTKQYTSGGCHARILCTDRQGAYPVVALALLETGEEVIRLFDCEGRFMASGSDFDLREVKPRIQIDQWVNVYPGYVASHSSRQKADSCRLTDRIACVKVTIDCEHGEGL